MIRMLHHISVNGWGHGYNARILVTNLLFLINKWPRILPSSLRPSRWRPIRKGPGRTQIATKSVERPRWTPFQVLFRGYRLYLLGFYLLSEIFFVMIRCLCDAQPANQSEVKGFYRGSAFFFIGLNEDVQRRRRVMRSQVEEVICEPNDVPFLRLSIKPALLSKIMENRVEVSHLVFETSESFRRWCVLVWDKPR
jgi:hypothetical protein